MLAKTMTSVKISPDMQIADLAAYIATHGAVHNRTQLSPLSCGGMGYDPNAPVVITRAVQVKLGRSRGWASYDGVTLRVDIRRPFQIAKIDAAGNGARPLSVMQGWRA